MKNEITILGRILTVVDHGDKTLYYLDNPHIPVIDLEGVAEIFGGNKFAVCHAIAGINSDEDGLYVLVEHQITDETDIPF